jgi:hypothetical protein
MSRYLKTQLVEQALRNTPWTPPATVYLALYLTDPTTEDVGVEPDVSLNYARLPVAFSPSSGGEAKNTLQLTYPNAGMRWGTVGWWGLRTAPTGGYLLWFGQLAVAQLVDVDYIARINAAALAASIERQ